MLCKETLLNQILIVIGQMEKLCPGFVKMYGTMSPCMVVLCPLVRYYVALHGIMSPCMVLCCLVRQYCRLVWYYVALQLVVIYTNDFYSAVVIKQKTSINGSLTYLLKEHDRPISAIQVIASHDVKFPGLRVSYPTNTLQVDNCTALNKAFNCASEYAPLRSSI